MCSRQSDEINPRSSRRRVTAVAKWNRGQGHGRITVRPYRPPAGGAGSRVCLPGSARHRHHHRLSESHKDVLKIRQHFKDGAGPVFDAGRISDSSSTRRCRREQNIGAQLQTDQAEADKRIARQAEERRAMAVAEAGNEAAVQEMRAKVVEAEARVPRALAAALKEGAGVRLL